jgi:hypothetical protein
MKRCCFEVGDRVRDRDGRAGRVVYRYAHRELRDEIIAVWFENDPAPLAVPIDTIKLIKAS